MGSRGIDGFAIYAACISTITLVWNISNAILEKIPHVKIHADLNMQLMGIAGYGVIGKEKYILTIKITNKSIYDIYLGKPCIKLQEKIDGYDYYYITLLSEPVKYPIHIKPRELYSTDIDLDANLYNLLSKCKNKKGKIRIKVTDTTDKNFYSNKISIERIISLAKKNCN